ncbi:hypothetical protein ABZW18_30840 [Streptomyces sp. NPDC004647]|uniref:hypothetical protein n=1 Tax=Streptomyces sp. NPDC004647 TaxID=3154671 RepID=UPI0033B2988E
MTQPQLLGALVLLSALFTVLFPATDVIHVMCRGRHVARLPGAEATYRDILAHSLP